MAADRSRLTYYPPRKYREVVSQQGRVLLEADSNEGQRISAEEVRRHALDFVGPCGTPEADGYRVTPLPGGDFQVGPGTMYVGGLRTTLEQAIKYTDQPDWLDKAGSQPWADLRWRPPAELRAGNTYALLVLREQEVTAVEDPALREVALGGPDSSARVRLLQRVVAFDVGGGTCADAAKEVAALWSALGLIFDPATATLRPRARLQVTLVTDPPSPSPCDPPAASGYLGADNQLLRVQVTAFDATTGKGKLVWGYHNAATLYRCRAPGPTTIELASRPVSAEFQPRSGQVVQVLPPAADLGEGAFAAAVTGHTAKLTAPYAPDTRRVTLPAALPAALQVPAGSPPLFLRLWDDEVEFTLDTAVTLAGTGLRVTISRSTAGALHLGDHWSIGVRPLTPNAVYPERYLTAAQPPDGPRLWACPLAVLRPSGNTFQVEDCREPFDDLTELTARKTGTCCCVTVGPQQAKDLQQIIDQAVQAAAGAKVLVHLEPGVYDLPRSLILEGRHKGVVLESCTAEPAVLTAGGADDSFALGLVVIHDVEDVMVRGLEFRMVPSPLTEEMLKTMELVLKEDLPDLDLIPRAASIGLHALRCSSLTVDSCAFQLPTGSSLVYGAGILIQGDNGQIEVSRCLFAGGPGRSDAPSVLIGINLAAAILPGASSPAAPSSVEILRVESCQFSLITVGMLLVGRPYFFWVAGNIARSVYSAFQLFWFDGRVSRPRRFFEMLSNPGHPRFTQLAAEIRQDSRTVQAVGLSLVWPSAKFATGVIIGRRVTATRDRLDLDDAGRATIVSLGRLDPTAVANVQVFPDGPCLTMESNQFEAIPIAPAGTTSGMGVTVWVLTANAGTVTLTGNTIWNRSALPAVVVSLPEGISVTGNVIGNQAPGQVVAGGVQPARALLVLPGGRRGPNFQTAMFTVTGNTIFGATNLADFPREEWRGRLPNGSDALLSWEFFNAIG